MGNIGWLVKGGVSVHPAAIGIDNLTRFVIGVRGGRDFRERARAGLDSVQVTCGSAIWTLLTWFALQLDAIPTVGFSTPILLCISAIRFTFGGVCTLNEEYKKVICLSIYAPSSYQPTTLPPLDKARSIQNCQFPQLGDAGYRK
jgi:hypothetical protein